MKNLVDRVHGEWSGRRGSGPWWTEVAQTRWRGGALSVRGVWALGLTSAHRRRQRRMSRTRRCQRGTHGSTSGGGEAAIEAKNDGGWSSVRGRRKAQGSSGERRKRDGEGLGCLSPFIRVEGAPRRGCREGNRRC
jgi:hypothetical protein